MIFTFNDFVDIKYETLTIKILFRLKNMGCTQSHSGMFYAICSDLLITGATLWHPKTLKNNTNTRKQLYAGYEIVAKDSLQDKAHALVTEASLILSLLCDLINFCGPAIEYISHPSVISIDTLSVP